VIVYMFKFMGGSTTYFIQCKSKPLSDVSWECGPFFFLGGFFAWITIERQSWIPMSKQRMAFNTVLKAHGVGGVKPMG